MYVAILAGVVVLLAVLQVLTALAVTRHQRAAEQNSDRLSHLVAALSLLTDTTESGLRDVISELERAAAAQARPRPATGTTRRIAAAARRGRSVQEIASTEQVSESEVKLRLQLGAKPRTKQAATAANR